MFSVEMLSEFIRRFRFCSWYNISMTASSGTLTIAEQPTAGDTMTIGGKTFIFVSEGTADADTEIPIGTDLPTTQANIVAAING